tara:strand:+ start:129843 stop:130916 length:1074 start_codon:yes stop_codon:yes gene_type:complete
MPELDKTRTFFDPITLEDIDIHDESAVFYLLVLPNNAGFKVVGSTQNLNSPESRFDPETRIKECWLVNRETLNHADMSILFPDDKLRSEPFKTLEALNAAFRFTPRFDPTQPHETIKKHTFGPGVAHGTHRHDRRRARLERGLGARPTPALVGDSVRMFDPRTNTYTRVYQNRSTRPQPRRQQASMQEDGLNYWQREALRELASHGLTEAMLLTRHDHGHTFYSKHSDALTTLVTARHFTVPQALAEIEGLTHHQAEGIKNGLTRSDVINLTNYWHIHALKELAPQGLTAHMLLTHNDYEFFPAHSYALINLITERHFTVPEALAEIEGLTNRQAKQIRQGLTRDEVMNPDAPRPGF